MIRELENTIRHLKVFRGTSSPAKDSQSFFFFFLNCYCFLFFSGGIDNRNFSPLLRLWVACEREAFRFWVFFTRLMSNIQASGRKLNLRDLLHFAIKTSTDVFIFPMKYKCLCSGNVFGCFWVTRDAFLCDFTPKPERPPALTQAWMCWHAHSKHSLIDSSAFSFLRHTASGTLSQEQLLYSWTMFLYTFILTRFLVKQGCSDILTQQPLRHSHCFLGFFFSKCSRFIDGNVFLRTLKWDVEISLIWFVISVCWPITRDFEDTDGFFFLFSFWFSFLFFFRE